MSNFQFDLTDGYMGPASVSQFLTNNQIDLHDPYPTDIPRVFRLSQDVFVFIRS